MNETPEEKVTRLAKEIKERSQEVIDITPYCFYGPEQERPEVIRHCYDELAWIRHRADIIKETLQNAEEAHQESRDTTGAPIQTTE